MNSALPIVLAVINAKWIHPSLALRLLKANLGEYEEQAVILEFALRQPLAEKVEPLLAARPRILGLSVSIWNHRATEELLEALKARWGAEPPPVIVLGGPEVSHLDEDAAIFRRADWVIRGEGELAFRELCCLLLGSLRPQDLPALLGKSPAVRAMTGKFIDASVVDLSSIDPGYRLYTGEDLRRKLIYVEASRGCPFGCEFCLSSLDRHVREFPLESLLADLEALIHRGGRTFKFLDRSFNLDIDRARRIMEFFLDKAETAEAGKIKKQIDMIEPITIHEPEGEVSALLQAYYEGKQGWRNKILDWAKSFIPDTIDTPDGKVHISRSNIRDSLAHGKGPLKVLSIPYLPYMITKGILFYAEKEMDKQGRPWTYYNYACPLIFRGDDFVISITIKEDHNGKRYYDSEFINKIKSTDELTSVTGPSTRGSLTHPSIKKILQKIITVKVSIPTFCVHFEMIPSRLPPELRETIRRFPPGSLRLELGVQTLNQKVAALIGRPGDPDKELEALAFLREKTQAIAHVDLIAGLPGEDMASFAQGFDRLWRAAAGNTGSLEIQLGILKRLPGTPIARHDQPYGMRYSAEPPYEALETAALPAKELARLKNFARFWELIVNRGNFPDMAAAFFPPGEPVFSRFMALSDSLLERFGRNWGIDRKELRNALPFPFSLTPSGSTRI